MKSASGRVGLGMVPWISAWFGALAGLAEAGHLTLRHLIERQPQSGFGWELAWMAPLSALAAFLVVGLVLLLVAALARVIQRRSEGTPGVSVKPIVLIVGFLACYSVLGSPELRMHWASAMLLSAGIATVCARRASTSVASLTRLVRRSSLAIGVLLAVTTTAGVRMLPRLQERRALEKLPPASAALPNVILLILDTVRAASMSLYGYENPTTPNLERWAAKGVVFERAMATAPWTLPSHASLFTGRHPQELSAEHLAPLNAEHPTLAEALREAGYATAGFVANFLYTTRTSGLSRGFSRYEDFPISGGRFLTSSWLSRSISELTFPSEQRPRRAARKNAVTITDDFLEWLSEAPGDRPFFAFLNYMDGHGPYNTAPARIRKRFQPVGPVVIPQRREVSEAEMLNARAAYEAGIAFLDEQLDRLLNEFERRRLLARTLIIVTSDHGEQFGENGLPEHGNSLSMFLLHVPLLMIYPSRVPAGVRVTMPVSLRDIPATVVDLIGIQPAAPFPGKTLRRYWDDAAGSPVPIEPVAADVTMPTIQSVLVHPYHYIRRVWGKVELYDVVTDYREERDLSRAPEHAIVLSRLAKTLDSIWTAAPAHPSRPPPPRPRPRRDAVNR